MQKPPCIRLGRQGGFSIVERYLNDLRDHLAMHFR
jgi:hypothetical protein